MDPAVDSLNRPRMPWDTEALERQLAPLLPGLQVQAVAEVDSSNTRLLTRARAEGSRPGLLVAEQQSAGRGRMGRGWVSEPGRSLTFSLALPLVPRLWEGLSLAVGLALAEALEPAPAAEPRLLLKWPNDLWLRDARVPAGGRKLGGILIETLALGSERVAVIGIGLNLLPLQTAESAMAWNHGMACLQEIDADTHAPAALALLAPALVQALKRFEQDGFAPLQAAYARRDVLLGRDVSVHGGTELTGVADGVDTQGALCVRVGTERHRVVSGEASVRPAAMA